MWIEPKGFAEVHSRGNVEPHRLQDPEKWTPYGVGAIEGQSARSLPVLAASNGLEGVTNDTMLPSERAASEVNAGMVQENDLVPEEHRPVYGPGEEPRPPDGAPQASAHGELL